MSCLLFVEASSAQRLSKLLQGKAKSKQASLSSQQQAAPLAITPAMRQHATARISQALRDNSTLDLERPRAEAGAARWESETYKGSSSKSAYLSKLANTVSQIKRASDLVHLNVPPSAFEPDQGRQYGEAAQDAPVTGAQEGKGVGMLTEPQQRHDPQTAAVTAARQHQPSLQPVTENELQRLMQLLSGKECSSNHDDLMLYLPLC